MLYIPIDMLYYMLSPMLVQYSLIGQNVESGLICLHNCTYFGTIVNLQSFQM